MDAGFVPVSCERGGVSITRLHNCPITQSSRLGVPLGIYISVPFCRTKCSYCNFASGVFSRELFSRYVDRLCAEIASAPQTAAEVGGQFERAVDSIYLGGGTPTMLPSADLEGLFRTIRQSFDVQPGAEITVECAPGVLAPEMLDSLLRCGVNRVSLGVQSFVDGEAAAVGRLHSRRVALDDIARMRAAGIGNINVDLIAGLPHQGAASWRESLNQTIAAAVPHVSVYMLEIDEDSRLGRELIAGGTRYHAHFVPDEDATADFYLDACERFTAAGIHQYEISNFARPGCESRHNLKYWTRQPYLGFGVDAHSMLRGLRAAGAGFRPDGTAALRFSSSESLDAYLAGAPLTVTPVSRAAALEEAFFLGLRLTCGIDLCAVQAEFGSVVAEFAQTVAQLCDSGLLEREGDRVRLTARGRLLSNEVFQRFLRERTAKVEGHLTGDPQSAT